MPFLYFFFTSLNILSYFILSSIWYWHEYEQEVYEKNGKYMLLKLDKRHEWRTLPFSIQARQRFFSFELLWLVQIFLLSFVPISAKSLLSHCNQRCYEIYLKGRKFLSFHIRIRIRIFTFFIYCFIAMRTWAEQLSTVINKPCCGHTTYPLI